MSDNNKSLQEIAYNLTTTILSNCQNEPRTRENILSVYIDCYNTIYDGKVSTKQTRAAA